MVSCSDLRKIFRLGAVSFVATGAQDGGIKLGRLHGARIVGMPDEGSVTGLASDSCMDALLLLVHHIAVANLTCLVTGEGDRSSCNFADRIAAEMPVLPKTAWHDRTAEDDKCNYYYSHHGREPQEVPYVVKWLHQGPTCRVMIRLAVSLEIKHR